VAPFSLLVKPASADCNLRCAHCFYLDRSRLYPETTRHRMSDEVLERTIASYMATAQPQYVFGWQGGEPTLMGVDFFRRVTDLQQKHGRGGAVGGGGAVVANGLQTNAGLIDDELAAHLAEYNFLVGVSLDGPEELHDRYRRDAAGRGSHADALRGIDRLARREVPFNILTLVTAANVGRAREVYRYLRDRGFLFHQYVPCVEFDGAGEPLPFAISGGQWGDFLCAIYDEWRAGDAREVSVRLFDAVLSRLVGGEANICHLGRDCRQYFVVEYNGDVYPCDFFVERELRLGSAAADSWEELARSEKYREFGARKSAWGEECARCDFLELCAGDCPRHRRPGEPSRLCAGWKRFFTHALPGLRRLADEVAEERRARPAVF